MLIELVWNQFIYEIFFIFVHLILVIVKFITLPIWIVLLSHRTFILMPDWGKMPLLILVDLLAKG